MICQADTITRLGAEARGAVVISGSHGGIYPGSLAAHAGVLAVILNDAGIGKDEAGIGALAYLDALGIAAATVSYLSCRIGDTTDMWERGRISRCNEVARAVGVREGEPCAAAAAKLENAIPAQGCDIPPHDEALQDVEAPGPRRIVLADSASLVTPDLAGQIVVTGSHGGLVGGIAAKALRADAFAAAFHDAGIGCDRAGITRLPALDRRGIAAVTVAAASARIGDARSVYAEGIISAANERARTIGAVEGLALRTVLREWSRLP